MKSDLSQGSAKKQVIIMSRGLFQSQIKDDVKTISQSFNLIFPTLISNLK